MSFFAELKRRNVFRVGVAYVVGGWLLLQLTEVLSELLKLPDEIGPIVVAVVLIGFPIALFSAWAFELTPEGVKRESEVDRSKSITQNTGRKLNNAIVVLLLLAVSYLLFDKFSVEGPDPNPNPATGVAENSPSGEPEPALNIKADAEPVINRRSIAVLPFDNRSPDANDAYFTEGIHDDLLTNLARIGSLKVISRTSVSQYKDTEKTIPVIASELGVATVMEGAVQRAGNTVRINVQLIDAETDEHLWAEIFDRELTTENLFKIQTEISEAIADALKATLSSEEQDQINRKPTDNLAAYNAYLRGRQSMARRTSSTLQQAIREYERAVELDPEFALAWVGIAESVNLFGIYGDMNPGERAEQMNRAVARALELDPTLGEAYVSLAVTLQWQNKEEEAEEAYQRAIELNPNYSTAYHWYADMLKNNLARLDEAIAMSERALELDPLSSIIRVDYAETVLRTGDYHRTELLLNEVIDLDPDFALGYVGLADLELNRGNIDKSLAWNRIALDKDPGNIDLMTTRYFDLRDLGLTGQAENVYEKMVALNGEHITVFIVSTFSSILDNKPAAAREQAESFIQKFTFPWAPFFAGMVHAYTASYDRAKELMLSSRPGYLEPDKWPALLEEFDDDACMVGWVLLQTGDEELGRQLLQETVVFLEETLPRYIKHADSYDISQCYAALGDVEAVVADLETVVEHNHIAGWNQKINSPAMQIVRDDPRFIELNRRVNEEIQRQAAVVLEGDGDARGAGP